MITEQAQSFIGLKVYYSGSIKGAPEPEPDFAWQLVQYMQANGADVLSEHVAARHAAEMENIRLRRTGIDMSQESEPWFLVREIDNDWVDQATHLVAVVNAPSHGVGMEIEHALHKPLRGLNRTPILCLVHIDLLASLSYMIRGIPQNEWFTLATYTDLKNAKEIIRAFLSR